MPEVVYLINVYPLMLFSIVMKNSSICSSCGNEQEHVWSEIVENYKLMVKGEIQQFDDVKGLSILVRLLYFTWTTQIACDMIHNLLEGLCAKLLNNLKNKYNIDAIYFVS